jgi:hypothetical protein
MPRIVHILILIFCVGIFAAAFMLSADDSGVNLLGWKLPMTCSLYKTFHIKCATCGMTRAFVYAAHGNWARANEMNSIWPVVAAAFFFEMLYRVVTLSAWPAKAARPLRVGHAAVLAGAIAVVLGHWAIYLTSLLR